MRPEEQAQVGPVGVVKHREPHPPFLRAHPPCEPEDEGGGGGEREKEVREVKMEVHILTHVKVMYMKRQHDGYTHVNMVYTQMST